MMMKLILAVVTVALLGGAAVGTVAVTGGAQALHEMTHKIGICSSTHCSLSAIAAGGSFKGCALDGTTADLSTFTEDELKIINFVSNRIVAEGEIPDFTGEEIEEATGVSLEYLEEMSQDRLQGGVLAELNRRQFNLASLAGTGNCARFNACSIDRNLAGAGGAELARYEKEKAQDGQAFADWAAPDFTLPSTSGDTVSLADFRGENVALVFLAGHCNHCLDSLSTFAELHKKYKSEGVRVVPVYVNSGTVEDIRSWTSSLDLRIPFLVSESNDLAEEYDFRMVPTTFLIDGEGRVTRKLVGQKSVDALDDALGEFAAGTRS